MAEKKPKSAAPAKSKRTPAAPKLKKRQAAPAKPKVAPKKAAPVAPPKPAPRAKGGKGAPPPPPVEQKRKPSSITITRPEATRPPLVELPPPKFEAPIGAPSILLPRGGQPVSSATPIMRWMYVGGATRYEVEWSPDTHFGRGHSVTIVSLQTAITLDTAHALKPATDYRWRVRGGNDAGWGPWSETASFRVSEVLTPGD